MKTAYTLLHALVFIAYVVVIIGILVQSLPLASLIRSPPVNRILLATISYILFAIFIEGILRYYRPDRNRTAG